MAYRFHRNGDRRIENKEVEVHWTPAYQSYFSAGDEAEPYCGNCDEELMSGWSYCPHCGCKLVVLYEVEGGFIKGYGIE